MAEVVWTDQAIEQLDLIVAYVELFDGLAAERLRTRLFDVGSSLCDFPHRGRPVGDGRRELVTVPPYVLRYRTEGDLVFIIGVRHGARRPD
ncbi:MAG: type II toxin-antitoxin system RelE/ParE family toxin [Sphingomonas taxi]|uniref:Type II toxin-antitoxin system RelE/ParE family toxin n=1 Tax=Sphingomonas taxi TaxID=1549858 RepID=A0A2W5PCZ1_9SPHN|nr:MAG: type II toxin-antitoxin system RelE/ParE family toxin [Sphingomonas taxi]